LYIEELVVIFGINAIYNDGVVIDEVRIEAIRFRYLIFVCKFWYFRGHGAR
jgi:hypothetical protein